jgi:hypothetical protein
MKKKFTAVAVFLTAAFTTVVILLASCMGTNGVLSGVDTTSALGNIIGSVLGVNRVSEANLVGTWKYTAPGCAFTSDNLLAKAGGEVAAQKIKSQLLPYYQSLGIAAGNTLFTFKEDKTFSGKLAGKSISGTYTYDPQTGAINLKTLLLSMNGYVTLTTKGISLLFESQKILSVMQTLGALSGNSTIGTISEISKNYDGVRVGFELSR